MLTRLFDLRRDEAQRVGLMFALLSLIIATSYVLKPVRSSLFLSEFGANQLPYVYLLVAVVLALVAAGFARWIRGLSLQRVFSKASLFFALNLIAFWFLVGTESQRWTGFLFYIWVSVFTAVMPSLYWLLANYVFYPSEGRRIFPILTAGGLFGSILGAATTWILVPLLGTRALMIVAALSLAAVASLATRVLHQEKARIQEQRAGAKRTTRRSSGVDSSALSLVRGSRHLTLLALLILVTSTTSTLIDYQFNLVVEKNFSQLDELTRFFGTFFGFINVLAFILELTLAGRLLRRLGLAGGLLILPSALGLSSLSFALFPSLLTAAAIKTSDDGLSNSLNKSSVELLFLPLSLDVKNRVKSWLDMFVERLGRGLGGITILAMTAVSSEKGLSVVVLALLFPWVALAFALKRQYGITFRDSIARRETTAASARLEDPESLSVLQNALDSEEEREQLYGLELIHETDNDVLLSKVASLVHHPNPLIRRQALIVLGRCERAASIEGIEGLEELTGDPEPSVASAALTLLLGADPDRGRAVVSSLIEREQAETIVPVLEHWSDATPDWLRDLLNEARVANYLRSKKPIERKLAAVASPLIFVDTKTLQQALSPLINDADIEVARAAIASLARGPDESARSMLIDALGRPPLRAALGEALSRIGGSTIETLVSTLQDVTKKTALRIGVARVLANFDDQPMVDSLLSSLPLKIPTINYQIVKTLGKLRNRFELRFPTREIDRLLDHEQEQLLMLRAARRQLATTAADNNEGTALLVDALDERIDYTRERIFRLLGLIYPASDIFNAWNRIQNGRPSVRSAAIEYLSTLLNTRHRNLLRLAEPLDEHSDPSGSHGGIADVDTALSYLLSLDDAWLATCAAHAAGELGKRQLRGRLEALSRHPVFMLQQSAAAALDKITEEPR